jgi:N6-L-threonylcarbamoyladenine synthase
VPEIASRAHLQALDRLVEAALAEAGLTAEDIDLFAAGAGPGLIGGVIVGLNMAKALAMSTGKHFVAVNHLEAHALLPTFFDKKIEMPYLALLASGGHTQILRVGGVGSYRVLGSTLDDAAGECFDKVGKMLGYNYMGGKLVEQDAAFGNAFAYEFPRPLMKEDNLDFSFSGLKTAVANVVEAEGLSKKFDIAASFQRAVCDVVGAKVRRAIVHFGSKCSCLTAGGGVIANGKIRLTLDNVALAGHLRLSLAPAEFCTDNGVMIAHVGALKYEIEGDSPYSIGAKAKWPLGDKEPSIGRAGKGNGLHDRERFRSVDSEGRYTDRPIYMKRDGTQTGYVKKVPRRPRDHDGTGEEKFNWKN